jgi:hypothetical protein
MWKRMSERNRVGHIQLQKSDLPRSRNRSVTIGWAAASAVAFVSANIARADSEIVGWDTTSLTSTAYPNGVATYNATTVDPGLGGVGGASSPVLSVGSGLNPDNSQYYSPGFLVYGTNSTSDLASAQSKNQYFQFTLTPTTGEA